MNVQGDLASGPTFSLLHCSWLHQSGVHLKMDFGFSILDVASKSGSEKWIQILILDVTKIQIQNVNFGIKSWMPAQILDLENGFQI